MGFTGAHPRGHRIKPLIKTPQQNTSTNPLIKTPQQNTSSKPLNKTPQQNPSSNTIESNPLIKHHPSNP
jgi:hypothetical protein